MARVFEHAMGSKPWVWGGRFDMAQSHVAMQPRPRLASAAMRLTSRGTSNRMSRAMATTA